MGVGESTHQGRPYGVGGGAMVGLTPRPPLHRRAIERGCRFPLARECGESHPYIKTYRSQGLGWGTGLPMVEDRRVWHSGMEGGRG